MKGKAGREGVVVPHRKWTVSGGCPAVSWGEHSAAATQRCEQVNRMSRVIKNCEKRLSHLSRL